MRVLYELNRELLGVKEYSFAELTTVHDFEKLLKMFREYSSATITFISDKEDTYLMRRITKEEARRIGA